MTHLLKLLYDADDVQEQQAIVSYTSEQYLRDFRYLALEMPCSEVPL